MDAPASSAILVTSDLYVSIEMGILISFESTSMTGIMRFNS
jgi:hypothetical protein